MRSDKTHRSGKGNLYRLNWTESSSYTRPEAEVYRHYAYCGKKLYFNQFFAAIQIGKYSIVGALILLTCSAVNAQRELQMNINYNVNFPAGSFRDLITNPAYKGFTAGLAYPLNDQLSVGLSVGYNDYYQKYPRQLYQQGDGSAISAVVSNSIQQLPLLLTADYTFLKQGIIRPYVGAGAGVNFISFDQYLGEFDNPRSFTRWALRGEVGILIPLSHYSSTALKIGGSYNYAPFNNYGVSNLDNWGVHAGIRFAVR